MVNSASSEPATSWMYSTLPLSSISMRKSALAESPERSMTISGEQARAPCPTRSSCPRSSGRGGLYRVVCLRRDGTHKPEPLVARLSDVPEALHGLGSLLEDIGALEEMHGPLVALGSGLGGEDFILCVPAFMIFLRGFLCPLLCRGEGL